MFVPGYMAAADDPELPYVVVAWLDAAAIDPNLVDQITPVTVWDTRTWRPTARFDTVFGFSGRLALTSLDGRPVVLAAALNRSNLAAYDGLTGEILWQRRDVRPVLSVSAIERTGQVAIGRTRGPLLILDGRTGETRDEVPGATDLLASPYAPIAVAGFDGRSECGDLEPWHKRWRVNVDGFAVLDAAFSRDAVLISDAVDFERDERDGVYLFDLDGQLRWRHHAPPGWNAPWLTYDPEADEWLAVVQDLDRRAPHRLVRWSADGAELDSIEIGDAMDYAFVHGGRLLVDAGRAIDTRTGAVVGTLTTG